MNSPTTLGPLALTLMFAAACGQGASVDGKVAGQSMTVRDAIFLVPHGPLGQAGSIVILSDQENLCDKLLTERTMKKASFLVMNLTASVDGRVLAPDVREYRVGVSSPIADVAFLPTDTNGSKALEESRGRATSGYVRVEELDTDHVMRGSFELQVGFVDSLKGSFEARRCFATREVAALSFLGALRAPGLTFEAENIAACARFQEQLSCPRVNYGLSYPCEWVRPLPCNLAPYFECVEAAYECVEGGYSPGAAAEAERCTAPAACGPDSVAQLPCGPANCNGCCTTSGICIPPPYNSNSSTCGRGGAQCSDCWSIGASCSAATLVCVQ
ncbi:MAG: hypothetical protein AB1938_13045 [Myxococcota bacterium]